jgi:hypothetical protein
VWLSPIIRSLSSFFSFLSTVTDMMTNPPTGPLVLNLRLAMAQRP